MLYLRSQTLHLIVLTLILSIFYGATIFNGFVHDDLWLIAKNESLKSWSYLPKTFTECGLEHILGGTCRGTGFYYRPIFIFTNFLTYQISQSATLFHTVHLGYVAVLTLTVYLFLKTILGKGFLPFFGALFFLTHPINSEVANWVATVPEIFLVTYFLLALILSIHYVKRRKIVLLILSSLSYAIALFSKETALFLLPLIPLYHLTFRSFRKRGRALALSGVAYALPTSLYFLARSAVLGRSLYKQETFYSLSLSEQIINAVSLFPKYLLKLIYPLPLSLQHRFDKVGATDWQFFLGLATAAVSILVVYQAYRSSKKELFFGFAIIIFGLLPVLVFIDRIGEFIFSERYLLLPSVGFTVLLLEGVKWLLRTHTFPTRAILIGLFTLYLGLSFAIDVSRIADWKDQKASYYSILRVNPESKSAHLQLGKMYFREDNSDAAKQHFTQALILDPTLKEAASALELVSNSYRSPLGISFHYPQNWQVSEEGGIVGLATKDNSMHIRLRLETRDPLETADGFLGRRKDAYGIVVTQGLAKIKPFQPAFLRIWNDGGVAKYQFFLFQEEKVVDVLAWPFDERMRREFDEIMPTLRVN